MADYSIAFARPARKELDALPLRTAERILRAVERLAGAPRPEGCRKLEGASDLWRLRMGDYRVIYSVTNQTREVVILHVRHRKDAYR